MSISTVSPLKVTFFDGAHHSLIDHSTGSLKSSLGKSGHLNVTDFIQSLSWSFSTKSPYEQIKISISVPVGQLFNILPTTATKKLITGFWVTIHSEEGKEQGAEFGKLLCWGRVATLNVSRRADRRTGAIVANVSLTAESWVHFLDQNMQIFTESGNRYPNKRNLRRGLKHTNAAAKQRWKDVTITGSEVINFYEGFKTATLAQGSNFFGEDRLGTGVSSYEDVLIDSSLGKSAANVYHKFAKHTDLPPALQGNLSGKLLSKNTVDFSSLIGFVFDGKKLLHDYSTQDSIVARDLSRFGYQDSVPMGLSSKLIIDYKSGFGVWSTLRKTYELDPNLVEMFPTLLEMEVRESNFERLPGINTEGAGRSKSEDYVFYADVAMSPLDPEFSLAKNASPELKTLEGVPFIFGIYSKKMGNISTAIEHGFMGYKEGDLTHRRMVPVIMYRLKPVHSPAIQHATFLTNWHNRKATQAGESDMPYNTAQQGEPHQTLSHAGKFPHFTVSGDVFERFTNTPYTVTDSEIVEFSASLSENKRITATCVRTGFSERLEAGLGFSGERELIINTKGFVDYGFRFYEFNFGLHVGGDFKGGNFNIIRALNEYGHYLLSREAEGMMGRLKLQIRPDIRAGMWVMVEFREEKTEASIYVDEVAHSTNVAANGSVSSFTEIKFSMMEFFGKTDSVALFGDLEISG